jgi:hypothetical protein
LTYYHATGEQPSFTAMRDYRGPFGKILRWCLLRLGGSPDDVRWINELQARSNRMTDRRGQKRRKRCRKNFKTDP